MTRHALRRVAAAVVALVLLAAVASAIFIATLTREASCQPGCDQPLATWQLRVAVLGAVPVGTLVYASATKRRRLAVASLVICVVIYALWGLLNDAAVHGWGHL